MFARCHASQLLRSARADFLEGMQVGETDPCPPPAPQRGFCNLAKMKKPFSNTSRFRCSSSQDKQCWWLSLAGLVGHLCDTTQHHLLPSIRVVSSEARYVPLPPAIDPWHPHPPEGEDDVMDVVLLLMLPDTRSRRFALLRLALGLRLYTKCRCRSQGVRRGCGGCQCPRQLRSTALLWSKTCDTFGRAHRCTGRRQFPPPALDGQGDDVSGLGKLLPACQWWHPLWRPADRGCVRG